ncbi:hypothetical protein [Desulfovibrio sp. UCD-KL4C]|uniref:hypothetical protein n=1 Tax=Desulfovibrio sp. UCD-KL4C TaxID=2578120 RepID=UPI0025C0247E|nr:hypothetical protein [Desulfovibrio sp. UCD-KL4C]
MKKLLILLVFMLLVGCATGKQAAPGYSIVETTKKYTVYQEDKTGELHKVDNSVMNCKYEGTSASQKNQNGIDSAANLTGEALFWAIIESAPSP